MRLIIIGASGLIGGWLFAMGAEQGDEVIGTCCGHIQTGLLRYDMRCETLSKVVADLGQDDVVYLFSAYCNPSWVFANPGEAQRLNIDATKKVIDAVTKSGARLIFMSSVEVFDGEKGNYDESAVPRPVNLYGRMKHEIETYLDEQKGRYTIVRTGWNVGWEADQRCVIALTYETLLKSGAKMAQDNVFSIIDVRDTARGLLKLIDDESPVICHLAASPPLVRTELAEQIVRLSRFGSRMAYETVAFDQIPYTEPRGRNNHLNADMVRSRLGMEFRPPEAIIAEKVALLDRAEQTRNEHD